MTLYSTISLYFICYVYLRLFLFSPPIPKLPLTLLIYYYVFFSFVYLFGFCNLLRLHVPNFEIVFVFYFFCLCFIDLCLSLDSGIVLGFYRVCRGWGLGVPKIERTSDLRYKSPSWIVLLGSENLVILSLDVRGTAKRLRRVFGRTNETQQETKMKCMQTYHSYLWYGGYRIRQTRR